MIIKRENEIQNFLSRNFYTIRADFGSYFGEWIDSNNSVRIFSEDLVEKIKTEIRGESAKIDELVEKQKNEQPPLAYDLTELQRDANRKLALAPNIPFQPCKHYMSAIN